jgi:hypothetical protein
MWVPAPRHVIGPELAGVAADELRMPKPFERLAEPPLFVIGAARSGTTFTLDVLAQQREVCAIVESRILSQTHGLTAVLTQEQWDLRASADAVDRVGMSHAAVQLLPYGEMVRELSELAARWLMRPVRPDKRFLVAKEPLDVRATAILFPEARFVHVIRDARDVALSMRRASESWDPSMGVGLPMSWRGEAWRRQVENARADRERLGDRYLEIRFEDLRADVARTARKVFEFAGIPYDDAVIERVRQNTRPTAYSESARRSGFRGTGRAGGWRDELTWREVVGVERAAGALLRELGYGASPLWSRGYLPRPRQRAAP